MVSRAVCGILSWCALSATAVMVPVEKIYSDAGCSDSNLMQVEYKANVGACFRTWGERWAKWSCTSTDAKVHYFSDAACSTPKSGATVDSFALGKCEAESSKRNKKYTCEDKPKLLQLDTYESKQPELCKGNVSYTQFYTTPQFGCVPKKTWDHDSQSWTSDGSYKVVISGGVFWYLDYETQNCSGKFDPRDVATCQTACQATGFWANNEDSFNSAMAHCSGVVSSADMAAEPGSVAATTTKGSVVKQEYSASSCADNALEDVDNEGEIGECKKHSWVKNTWYKYVCGAEWIEAVTYSDSACTQKAERLVRGRMLFPRNRCFTDASSKSSAGNVWLKMDCKATISSSPAATYEVFKGTDCSGTPESSGETKPYGCIGKGDFDGDTATWEREGEKYMRNGSHLLVHEFDNKVCSGEPKETTDYPCGGCKKLTDTQSVKVKCLEEPTSTDFASGSFLSTVVIVTVAAMQL